jgi:hypothetical protein
MKIVSIDEKMFDRFSQRSFNIFDFQEAEVFGVLVPSTRILKTKTAVYLFPGNMPD